MKAWKNILSAVNFPKISIFMFCKNGAATIRRSVESVLNLDYPNIEYIVQDGASTDGTREILESYEKKISLVSEPDTCAQEAFFRALKRCTGEIIGSCQADEELLPHAAKWAAENFHKNPEAIAIYGDSHNTDIEGNIIGDYKPKHPFTTEKYLLHEVVPTFASSFIRRSSIEQSGLCHRAWNMGGGEFELWVELSLLGKIMYCPGFISKFSVHDDQLTRTPEIQDATIVNRVKIINQFFNDPDFAKKNSLSKQQALAGLFLWSAQLSVDRGAYDEAVKHIHKAMPYAPSERRLQEFAGDCCNNALKTLRREQWSDAMRCLDCAEVAGGGFPDIQFLRAMAWIGLDENEKAENALHAHLQKFPDDSKALDLLGDLKTH
jgi:glycosyltransferase involved in cell wall biosynthesis